MDAKELKAMLEKIFELPEVERFAQAVSGILSYLKSEQEKRIELTKAMKDLTDTLYGSHDQVGIKHQLNEIQQRTLRNGKLSQGVVIGLAILVMGEGLRILLAHIK